MSEWISVEERLPEAENGAGESENVLIYGGLSGVGVGFYCHDENLWADQDGIELDPDLCVVTHWMPLPAAPEHAMLTGPEVLILCAFLAALYMLDWWQRNKPS